MLDESILNDSEEIAKSAVPSKIVGGEVKEINLVPTNQIFPSLPMTEESARAIAEKIKESIRR